MINVLCVLRSGGIYDAAWVARLQAGVAANLTVPHKFICLADMAVPCQRIYLHHDWPTWWSKMELFRCEGPALYFDLDTLIIGNIDDLARQAEAWEFTVLRDFHRTTSIGSGVMAWNVDLWKLYEEFAAKPGEYMNKHRHRGDQHFIEEHADMKKMAHWQDRLPGQIVSYKADKCQEGPPENARVVALHGEPKFTTMPAGNWARQMWEMAA